MSQTTRCPSCTTLFKVVPDQLRISDGWVRCGQCKQIFDAAEHLQTDAPAPPMRPAAVRVGLQALEPDRVTVPPAPTVKDGGDKEGSAAVVAPFAAPAPGVLTAAPAHTPVPKPEQEPDSTALESSAEAAAPSERPAAAMDTVIEGASAIPTAHGPPELPGADLPELNLEWLDFPEPEPEPEPEFALDLDPVGTAHPNGLPDTTAAVPPDAETDTAPAFAAIALAEPALAAPSAEDEPSFVRAARRKAFWRKPAVRTALALVSALLCCALAWQMAVQQRNRLAAAQPPLRPLLQVLCLPFQCVVGPHRDIAAVVVESSSFNRERGDMYQFAVTLKSRSDVPLETPAVELTLTDLNDQPVLRRIFLPQDFRAPDQLPAQGEWSASLLAQLATGTPVVAGYRVLAFYP